MNRLPLKIALRYLVSKKSHTAVSIISTISVCAVAVTAMAMVCVLSVFNGFSDLVNSKLSQIDPDIKITAATGKVIGNADSLLAIVKKIDGIEMATATVYDNALAIYGNRQVPITLKGVDDDFCQLTDIASTVKDDGTYSLYLPADSSALAVISVGTAVALQAHPGYYMPLELYVPKRKGAVNIANPMSAFRHSETFISGVFEVEQAEYDMNYAFVTLELARTLFDYGTEASAIEAKLVHGASESQTMAALSEALGNRYKVESRLMQHSHSLQMINIEKWMAFLLLGFILVIASFNIISTLAILIIEKDGSIRTLRAMGANNQMISRIFVTEGWLISVTGAAAGIIVGVLLCLAQQYFGFIKMSANAQALIIDRYPVIVRFSDMLSVLAIVALVGFITSSATAIAMRRNLRR